MIQGYKKIKRAQGQVAMKCLPYLFIRIDFAADPSLNAELQPQSFCVMAGSSKKKIPALVNTIKKKCDWYSHTFNLADLGTNSHVLSLQLILSYYL